MEAFVHKPLICFYPATNFTVWEIIKFRWLEKKQTTQLSNITLEPRSCTSSQKSLATNLHISCPGLTQQPLLVLAHMWQLKPGKKKQNNPKPACVATTTRFELTSNKGSIDRARRKRRETYIRGNTKLFFS